MSQRRDPLEAMASPVSWPWLAIVAMVSAMLVSICFSYSWSSFKLDLKELTEWDEEALNLVFTFGMVGQNLVVHMGMLSDACGMVATLLLAAALKFLGLAGLWWAASSGVRAPWVYGVLLLLDTQGMGAAIMAGQREVQRATPPQLSGVAQSICVTAFGLGAVYASGIYDFFFRPDVPSHFLFAGLSSAALLVACSAVVPILGRRLPPQEKKEAVGAGAGGESFWGRALSADFAGICAGMFVTWGLCMVWNSNMASFSKAAKLTNGAAIRSAFYTSKTVSPFVIGLLVDLVPGPRGEKLPLEVWYLVVTGLAYGAAALMFATGGVAMMPAAVVTGGCFGAIATLLPLLAKRLSPRLMGTFYALAKVAGLLSGVAWNWWAGRTAEAALAPGETNCVGDACYAGMWVVILLNGAPLLMFLVAWAARAAAVAGGPAKTE